MKHTIFVLNGNYTVQHCVAEDIDRHYKKMSEWVQDVDETDFKNRMQSSIDAGTAFRMDDDSCFIYYKNISEESAAAKGYAVYGKGVPKSIWALFLIVFSHFDKHTFKIDFHLHDGKMAQEYRSMLTFTSIKRNTTNPNYPLVVRVDKLRRRWDSILMGRKKKIRKAQRRLPKRADYVVPTRIKK